VSTPANSRRAGRALNTLGPFFFGPSPKADVTETNLNNPPGNLNKS
jgi:hypothetical protein